MHAAFPSDEAHHAGLGQGVIVARAFETGGRLRTFVTSSRAVPPLRLLRPTFPGTTSAAVCTVTFGGGLVDGDDIRLRIEVERGATLLLFTQSSTKVFRGEARQMIEARVEGTLLLLPDPVAAFAGSRYTQRNEIDLGDDGALVVLDGFTAGRAAFGERWAMDGLDLRTRVRWRGAPVVVDALRLERADGSIADRTGPYDAFGTLLALGSGARPVITPILADPIAPPDARHAIAASPLPSAEAAGLPSAIGRVAGARPMDALGVVRSWLRNLPEMDAVDPFASRY